MTLADARTEFVRLLTALHADGERLIDLLCAATDDLDPEQEAAFIAFCVAGDLDQPKREKAPPTSKPARAKARRPRKVPGQDDLF